MDLTGLLVERVVVHLIPKKESKANEEDQAALQLSDAVTPMTDELRGYLIRRLLKSLQSEDRAFDVILGEADVAPAPALVRSFLSAEADGTGTDDERDERLVIVSRELAKSLFEVQPPQPPAGLFAVCAGDLNFRPFVAVMKLERERGVTAEQTRSMACVASS